MNGYMLLSSQLHMDTGKNSKNRRDLFIIISILFLFFVVPTTFFISLYLNIFNLLILDNPKITHVIKFISSYSKYVIGIIIFLVSFLVGRK